MPSVRRASLRRHGARSAAALLLAWLAAVPPPAPAAAAGSDAPPNIVIILADDLGYGDIGAYGARRIRTPHIDRLAAAGLRFTQAYASANVCSPSRAGLLTGRYAIRSGLAYKVVTARDERGLPGREETIAELLRRGGYRSMLVGKWHLGRLPAHSPLKHGFDRFYGVPHSNDMPDFALYDGDTLIEQPVEQATLTRRYTDAAIAFIEAADQRPFLLLLSHTFPHIPLHASPRFRGVSGAGLYGDTVEELDHSTGRIVAALREAGLLQNTLVLFTSDNGPFFEGSSGALRGGKGNAWEGGYRVPFIAAWPARIPAGGVTDAITMNIDVLPTLAELAAVKPAAARLDGASLVPLFDAPDAAVHDYLLYFNNESVIGLRSRDWKYVTHAYYTGSLGAFEKFDQLPQFDGAYDLLLDARGADGEAYSYADRQPAVLASMKKILAAARAEFDPLRTRPADRTYPE